MDNLTHTLTGLVLSRAGLNRFYARPALVLMLAANIPDIDVVMATRGALRYFEVHRGITHSWFMLLLMALIPVAIACAVSKSMKGSLGAWCISMVGVVSHLLLDWTNAYGIRFLTPLSEKWFRLDLNNIVELWIWIVLLLACVAPMLGKLVNAEIGAKAGGIGRGWAIFGLSFILIYDFGKYQIHQRALETLNSRIYLGGPPIQVAAFPVTIVNPFRWQGWVDRPNAAISFSMNLLEPFDPASGAVYYKPEPGPEIEAARHTEAAQIFLKFAQFPLWRVTPVAEPEGAHRVEVRDWRFPFGAVAIVDASNHVLASSFHF